MNRHVGVRMADTIIESVETREDAGVLHGCHWLSWCYSSL